MGSVIGWRPRFSKPNRSNPFVRILENADSALLGRFRIRLRYHWESPAERKRRVVMMRFGYVLFGVLTLLLRLLWAPDLWKALFVLKPHLLDASRSGVVPGIHYSQDGEDVALLKLLPETGFFVDVGAHHPERFSVTKLLYDRGWVGVNLDVTPAIHDAFPKRRRRDLNIFSLVGTSETKTFYRFAEQALNTVDNERAEVLLASGQRLIEKIELPSSALGELLPDLSAPPKIDLLNVDVEGADLEVLKTMDWASYKVEAALVEIGSIPDTLNQNGVVAFLRLQCMVPALVFPRSVLFLREHHPGLEFFRPQ